MQEETYIVKIYNEKYNKYWTCTLKSYKTTWSQNGWVLVGPEEVKKPVYKEVPPRPWEKPKTPWYKKLIRRIFLKK